MPSTRRSSTAPSPEDLLAGHANDEVKPSVMGDCAYGIADALARLEDAGYEDVKAKVAPANGRDGRFGKDDFTVDLEAGCVTCPAQKVAAICTTKDGSGLADFAAQCTGCPLQASRTTSSSGSTVTIHAREDLLQAQKAAQRDGPLAAARATASWSSRWPSTMPNGRPTAWRPGAACR